MTLKTINKSFRDKDFKEIEKKLNIFRNEVGIKGKQRFQKLLNTEVVIFSKELLKSEREDEIKFLNKLKKEFLILDDKIKEGMEDGQISILKRLRRLEKSLGGKE